MLFGTDGIRGKPNERLTCELVLNIGRALSIFNIKEVVIGTDTRLSKDMLNASLTAGCLSAGLNVVQLDVLPTPALMLYSKEKNILGVMLTASHNPYEDNGIKIFKRGKKLSREEEFLIEEALFKNHLSFTIGKENYAEGGLDFYYNFLKSYSIPSSFSLAIDCANGATFFIAPKIFKEVTRSLLVLSSYPNGCNINENCGSTHLSSLKKAVVENGYDLGFAFDGDGDRIQCVDAFGNVISGDIILYILACYLKKRNQLFNNKVVLTEMSNIGIKKALKRKGIEIEEVNVGDRNVCEALIREGLSLGGEDSGHIILSSALYTGDGILIGLFLLKALMEEKKSLTDYYNEITLVPSVSLNVRVRDKRCIEKPSFKARVKNMKDELSSGKIVVRASGTEEVIRILVMDENKEKALQFANELASIVDKF